jgi:hypothetical protein
VLLALMTPIKPVPCHLPVMSAASVSDSLSRRAGTLRQEAAGLATANSKMRRIQTSFKKFRRICAPARGDDLSPGFGECERKNPSARTGLGRRLPIEPLLQMPAHLGRTLADRQRTAGAINGALGRAQIARRRAAAPHFNRLWIFLPAKQKRPAGGVVFGA